MLTDTPGQHSRNASEIDLKDAPATLPVVGETEIAQFTKSGHTQKQHMA